MRGLIFGDVVGEPGRKAVTLALPELKKEHQPDFVIINIENIAHGAGISPAVMPEVLSWQADVYTTGDHAWDNQAGWPILDQKNVPIIRPANYPSGIPGRGYHTFTKGAFTVSVINLHGQVFAKNDPLNPFYAIDDLLKMPDIKRSQIVLVDFHGEATSEKRGFGIYVDGRVSAVWGTHTHVPTADAQILPKGTGYITDLGMNGSHNSVIGFAPAAPLARFLHQIPRKLTLDSEGPFEVGALLLDIDPSTGKTINLAHIRKILQDR